MVDRFIGYRRRSEGYQKDAPALVHPCILFGAGEFITPEFVDKHTITHVINCAYDEDSPEWFRETYPERYRCINARDSLESNILWWYPVFKTILDSFLKDPKSKTIYVHCQCGINRSGFLVLLYICLVLGYEVESGIRMILRQRPCALTNPAYMKQSVEYIKKHT